MVREATLRLSPAPAPTGPPWPRWLRRLLTLWVAIGFWLALLVATPFYRLYLRRLSPEATARTHRLNRRIAQLLLWLSGCSVSVQGREHIPAGPVVFVANHRSYLDIPLCHVALPEPFVIVGKAELAQVPLFGWMYRRQHILLERERSTSGARALVAATAVLRAGGSVLIYPEGTTQHSHPLLAPFRPGAFLLAHKLGLPVVPIALVGTRRALPPDGSFLLQPGPLAAHILPPIDSRGVPSPEALAHAAHQAFTQALTELHA